MRQKDAWERLVKAGRVKWPYPDEGVVELVPVLKKKRSKRILDLGCGDGRHVVYLAKKNFFVVGSDIAPSALAHTKKWLRKEKIDNACLVENDMTKLPFPDESFDAVISVGTIHHNILAKIETTVAEIRRVLKKGGLVFVTVPSTEDYKFGIGRRTEYNTYLSDVGTAHHFFDEKGAKQLFRDFKRVEIRKVTMLKEKKTIVHRQIARKFKGDTVTSVRWYILAEK